MMITNEKINSVYKREGGKAVRELITVSETYPNNVKKIRNIISGTDVYIGTTGDKLIVPGSNTRLHLLFKDFFGNVGASINSYPRGTDSHLGGKFVILSPKHKFGACLMGDFLDLSKFTKVIDYMEQVVAHRKEYIFSARPTEEVAMRNLRQFIKQLK